MTDQTNKCAECNLVKKRVEDTEAFEPRLIEIERVQGTRAAQFERYVEKEWLLSHVLGFVKWAIPSTFLVSATVFGIAVYIAGSSDRFASKMDVAKIDSRVVAVEKVIAQQADMLSCLVSMSKDNLAQQVQIKRKLGIE